MSSRGNEAKFFASSMIFFYAFKNFSLSVSALCLFLILVHMKPTCLWTDILTSIQVCIEHCFSLHVSGESFSKPHDLDLKKKYIYIKYVAFLSGLFCVSHPHFVVILRIRNFSYILIWLQPFFIKDFLVHNLLATKQFFGILKKKSYILQGERKGVLRTLCALVLHMVHMAQEVH